jgi:hypothetical protein
MEMNLAFSDSELNVVKILNKGLCLCSVSTVPDRRYEAKRCRNVATPIMTCTCLSSASLLQVHPVGREYDCVWVIIRP